MNRFTKTRRISRALAVPHLRAAAAYASPAGSRPPGTGPKLACAGHYLDAKPHPTDIKLCQRIVLVTHSNFPHIDWAHNLLEVALKPGSKPPIFRAFGPSSPPKRTGLTAIRGVGGRIRPNKLADRLSQAHVSIQKCRWFVCNLKIEAASPDQGWADLSGFLLYR